MELDKTTLHRDIALQFFRLVRNYFGDAHVRDLQRRLEKEKAVFSLSSTAVSAATQAGLDSGAQTLTESDLLDAAMRDVLVSQAIIRRDAPASRRIISRQGAAEGMLIALTGFGVLGYSTHTLGSQLRAAAAETAGRVDKLKNPVPPAGGEAEKNPEKPGPKEQAANAAEIEALEEAAASDHAAADVAEGATIGSGFGAVVAAAVAGWQLVRLLQFSRRRARQELVEVCGSEAKADSLAERAAETLGAAMESRIEAFCKAPALGDSRAR